MSQGQGHQRYFKDTRRISKVTLKPDINLRYSDAFSLGVFLRKALSPIGIVSGVIVGQVQGRQPLSSQRY